MIAWHDATMCSVQPEVLGDIGFSFPLLNLQVVLEWVYLEYLGV